MESIGGQCMRQVTLQDLVPLPLRAAPRPWEDLASVLSRTARKMDYPHPKWILQPESIAHRIEPDALPRMSASEDYQMLGKLLGLDEERLVALTLHRFAPRLERSAISVSRLIKPVAGKELISLS